MKLIYVSNNMVEYMSDKYEHLTKDDIYEIVSASKIYSSEVRNLIHDNQSVSTEVKKEFYLDVPDLYCDIFSVDYKIRFYPDKNGVFIRKEFN